MKKILLFMVCCASAGHVFAQGFNARFGLGYAFPQAGQTMDGTGTPYNGNASNSTGGYTSYDIKKASLSAGLHGVVGLDYMFNKHIGVDASLDFMLGSKQYSYTEHNVLIGGVASDFTFINEARNVALFIPALVMQTDGDVLNLYTRIGVVVPMNTRVTQDQINTNLPGTGAIESDDFTLDVKHKFALGFNAAVGMKYRLNSRMKLWAEAGFLSLSVYTKEANMTDLTINGQSGYLHLVAEDQRKITYSTNFTSTTNDYFHQPAYSQPFSNFSISLGLHYDLHQHREERSREKGRNDVRSRRR